MCSWNWQNWLHKCILKGRHWRREREKKWKLKRAFSKILKWPIFNAGNRVVWKCENPITWTAVLLFCFLIHEALIITTKQNKKVKCRNKSLQNQHTKNIPCDPNCDLNPCTYGLNFFFYSKFQVNQLLCLKDFDTLFNQQDRKCPLGNVKRCLNLLNLSSAKNIQPLNIYGRIVHA